MRKFTSDYPLPAVTTDSVIFGFEEGTLKILLIERGIEPYKGAWSLPGGFLGMEEDAESCARRKLRQKTGLENIFMEQLFTFSDINRDPRFRVISIAYYALVKLSDYKVQEKLKIPNVKWFPLSEIPSLAFDHQKIVVMAKKRLEEKIKIQPIGFELLPEKFTMPELHQLYEAVLQTPLDRRNFRKKILSFNLLIDQQDQVQGVPHRAAKLYSFDKKKYEDFLQQGFYFRL